MKVICCVAMYNEEPVAQQVMEEIVQLLSENENINFVIVNDGSTDGTDSIINSFAHERLNVIEHANRQGVGACICTGLRFTKDNHATYFGLLPGNGRIAVSELRKLLDAARPDMPEYLIGSRFLPSGHHEGMPVYRSILIRVFSAVFSQALKIRLTDISCGLRLVSLQKWDHGLDCHFLNSKYAGEQILTLISLEAGLVIREIGISLVYSPMRPYSHLNVSDLPQIIWPWLRYVSWKRTNWSFLQPYWLKPDRQISTVFSSS